MAKPTFVEDDPDTGESVKYWDCPVRLIPACVWEWVGGYRYAKTFGAHMPSIDDVGPRWYRAWLVYEEALARGEEYGRRNN